MKQLGFIFVNGATAKTHDITRGITGGYKKIIDALNDLKKHKNAGNIEIGNNHKKSYICYY